MSICYTSCHCRVLREQTTIRTRYSNKNDTKHIRKLRCVDACPSLIMARWRMQGQPKKSKHPTDICNIAFSVAQEVCIHRTMSFALTCKTIENKNNGIETTLQWGLNMVKHIFQVIYLDPRAWSRNCLSFWASLRQWAVRRQAIEEVAKITMDERFGCGSWRKGLYGGPRVQPNSAPEWRKFWSIQSWWSDNTRCIGTAVHPSSSHVVIHQPKLRPAVGGSPPRWRRTEGHRFPGTSILTTHGIKWLELCRCVVPSP